MNTIRFLEEVTKSLKDADGLSVGGVDITDAKLTLTVGLGSCETTSHSVFLAELVSPTSIAIHERTINRPTYLTLCKGFEAELQAHYGEPTGTQQHTIKLDEDNEDVFSE